LEHLFALQKVDARLDELNDLKGDLPSKVQELESRRDTLLQQRAALEGTKTQTLMNRDAADSEIINLKGKLEKYKAQQFSVRNNREYDALTREMDSAADSISRLEAEMADAENKATITLREIEDTTQKIAELDALLEEKRQALTEVSKNTEKEELEFNHEREKILVRINKADITLYERIRKARQGKAVVAVKRGACGGCFNRIPPQKILELRRNDAIFTCERCGRILVSDEIAQSGTVEV
jgi:predicted  nucleic acid-binding Zn-ribbon protein